MESNPSKQQVSAGIESNAFSPLQFRRGNDIWQGKKVKGSLQALDSLHETAKCFAKLLVHDIIAFCSELLDSANRCQTSTAVIKALYQASEHLRRFEIPPSMLSYLNSSLRRLKVTIELMLDMAWYNSIMSNLGGGPYGYRASMAKMVQYLQRYLELLMYAAQTFQQNRFNLQKMKLVSIQESMRGHLEATSQTKQLFPTFREGPGRETQEHVQRTNLQRIKRRYEQGSEEGYSNRVKKQRVLSCNGRMSAVAIL